MVKIGDKLREIGVAPKKSLGQNFLVNEGIYKKIIGAISAKPTDIIVEVGAGLGTLTDYLLETGAKIIAVEKDDTLAEYLQKKYATTGRVAIVHEDILKFDPGNWKLEIGNWKLVGNIPYYLTSHLIQTVFETWPAPEKIVFTVQKEVARRIVAKPPEMSLLAVSVQYYSRPEIVAVVSRGSFRPQPKVDSAIIQLTPKSAEKSRKLTAGGNINKFFRVVKAGFSSKRKQLGNNLAATFHLPKKEIDAKLFTTGITYERRAETLTIEEWQKISNIF